MKYFNERLFSGWQESEGCYSSWHQHACRRAFWECAVWRDRTSEMAVRCLVTWCHIGQSYGSRWCARVREHKDKKKCLFICDNLLFKLLILNIFISCGGYKYICFWWLFIGRRVHITSVTLEHLNGAYKVEDGDGQERDPYLKEHGVVTYLVINPKVSNHTPQI